MRKRASARLPKITAPHTVCERLARGSVPLAPTCRPPPVHEKQLRVAATQLRRRTSPNGCAIEQGEQLAHRPVADLGVRHTESRAGHGREELPHDLLERLDPDAFVRLANALDQVRRVVEQARGPGPVVLDDRLVRLLGALAGSAWAISF